MKGGLGCFVVLMRFVETCLELGKQLRFQLLLVLTWTGVDSANPRGVTANTSIKPFRTCCASCEMS